MINYKDFPSDSRVWIYQSNRVLGEKEVLEIKRQSESFVENWKAHGKHVRATIEIFYDRFIVIFVDEKVAPMGGCSIDDSLNFIQNIEREFRLILLDRMVMAYRNIDGLICTCRLDELESLIEKKEIRMESIVFNNLVSIKHDFESKWELPLVHSWYWQKYGQQA